ncbi:hypothetical protein, partial [Pseudomonas syringae group genomosp. 7]|uniref:hypothetical protein n=1 Tax=Pseudomonas syringae group genomosp. 7 TaxID=251699 RepID=UPI003770382C
PAQYPPARPSHKALLPTTHDTPTDNEQTKKTNKQPHAPKTNCQQMNQNTNQPQNNNKQKRQQKKNTKPQKHHTKKQPNKKKTTTNT